MNGRKIRKAAGLLLSTICLVILCAVPQCFAETEGEPQDLSPQITTLSCGICDVKDNRDAIVTIISDDGKYATGCELNDLSVFFRLPVTIAGVVTIIDPYVEQWAEILRDGYIELISHTYSHLQVKEDEEVPEETLREQYEKGIEYFRSIFGSPDYVMILPGNSINALGYDIIRQAGVKAIRRGTRGLNSLNPTDGTEPGDWLNLKTYGIEDVSTTEERNSWIDEAIKGNKWLIEMWHDVSPLGGNNYQEITRATAAAHLAYVKACEDNRKIWTAHFSSAVRYIWERQHARIRAWANGKSISVSMEVFWDESEAGRMDEDLTCRVVLPDGWENVRAVTEDSVRNLRIEEGRGNYILYFDTYPKEQKIRFECSE